MNLFIIIIHSWGFVLTGISSGVLWRPDPRMANMVIIGNIYLWVNTLQQNCVRAKVLTSISHLFLVLNSSTNIIIYCWKDDKFKIVLFRMLRLYRPMDTNHVVDISASTKPATGWEIKWCKLLSFKSNLILELKWFLWSKWFVSYQDQPS